MGYKATYPHHWQLPVQTAEVEPLPEWVTIAGA
jgi:hypothetical protein